MPDYSLSNCTEQYVDIVNIYPIVVGELNHVVPFNVREDATTPQKLGLAGMTGFLSDRKRFSTFEYSNGSFLMGGDPALKVTPQKAISGYTFLVNLQFEMIGMPLELRTYLTIMTSVAHEFILEYSDGSLHFIRCPENSYRLSAEKNISTHALSVKVTFDINNINGVQPIIE